MKRNKSITITTTRIAAVMAVMIAFLLPAGYYVKTYQHMVGGLEAEAEHSARIVTEIISGNPEMWRYEELKIKEFLAREPHRSFKEAQQVVDLQGKVISSNGPDIKLPLVKRSHLLFDAGVPVANLVIIRSMGPLIRDTLSMALLGVAFGATLFIVLRVLPIRAIRRTEQAVNETNEFLGKVMESTSNGIFVVDRKGTIIMLNRRGAELSLYDAEELTGKHISLLFPGDDIPTADAWYGAMGRLPLRRFEKDLVRKNGTVMHMTCGAAPIIQQDGGIASIVFSAEDITEQKRADEKLQRYALELQETNEEIKNFAYILSHDLRAPLVNIKGFSAELKQTVEDIEQMVEKLLPQMEPAERKRLAAAINEDLPEALEFIDSSVQRMDKLIDAVLSLSRAGRRQVHFEPLDTKEMVSGILRTLQHQLEERHVTVEMGELPGIIADKASMEQIFANLLDNAVKYLEPSRPGRLEIFAEKTEQETIFRVRDNGRGIAEQDVHRIFDIFRRVGPASVKGDGMGLAYVKTVIRNQGGRIWCESTLGVGSTFSFSVPDDLADRSRRAEPSEPEANS